MSTGRTTALRLPERQPAIVRSAEQDALGQLDVATAALLSERSLLRRVDSKFVVPRSRIFDLLDAFRGDFSVVLSDGSPSASYETLYYDTPELALYHAHRRGRRPRSKVRVRHYAERDVCFLEVKTKDRYDVTDKQRVAHDSRQFGLTDSDRGMLATAIGTHEPLVPQIWVDFHRVTLVGVASEERVTLDLGLAFAMDDRETAFDDVVIAELKQPRFSLRSPGMHAFRELGVRPFRVSKYCVGVSLLAGIRQTHRFRPTVRELTRLAA